jgi:hypothetical protein
LQLLRRLHRTGLRVLLQLLTPTRTDDVLHAELGEAGLEPVTDPPAGVLAWRLR